MAYRTLTTMTRKTPVLDHAEWRARMRDFAIECDGSAADETAARVRELRALLAAAPVEAGALWPMLPAPSALDAMLAASAAESAALALLSPAMGFFLSRGSGGTAMASVVLSGSENDVTASGATPALALLCAMALALLGSEDARRSASDHRQSGTRLN